MRQHSYVWDLTREEIQEKVNKCNSLSDCLEAFGYSRNAGSMSKILKKIFTTKCIDTSHFQPFKRNNQTAKCPLEEILVPNSSYKNIYALKRRLIKNGLLEYKCEICGNSGIWNGEKLTLQLDHKDGDNSNHSLENLRFLCPNCHSQTSTFSGRNKTRMRECV